LRKGGPRGTGNLELNSDDEDSDFD
jgi:hypothetical protein